MTRSRCSKTGVYAPGEDYFVLNSSMISDDSSVEVISLTYYSTHIVNHRKYFARNISCNLSIEKNVRTKEYINRTPERGCVFNIIDLVSRCYKNTTEADDSVSVSMSGYCDANTGPSGPKPDALANCATPRNSSSFELDCKYTKFFPIYKIFQENYRKLPKITKNYQGNPHGFFIYSILYGGVKAENR